MKGISLFFAMYILALTMLPCTDISNEYHPTEESTTSSAHHDHEKSEDLCTPFCYCVCCSLSIIPTFNSIVSLFFRADFPNKKVIDTVDYLPSSFFCSIWQPPKWIV